MIVNNRDRGNIKWTAMMLPEHVNMLRDWQNGKEKTEKPQLDEFELDLISEEITRAFISKGTVRLTYWRDGYLKDDYGVIITLDNPGETLVIDDPFGTTRYKFIEVVAVSLIEGG